MLHPSMAIFFLNFLNLFHKFPNRSNSDRNLHLDNDVVKNRKFMPCGLIVHSKMIATIIQIDAEFEFNPFLQKPYLRSRKFAML